MLTAYILTTALVLICDATLPPPCSNPIYCYGPLLHTVQMSKVFSDSKDFVDQKLKYSPNQVLQNYDDFEKYTNGSPTKAEILKFVAENFESGDELENWTPSDYTPDPQFLSNIDDDVVKNFAQEIVQVWPMLGRKVKRDVFQDSSKYSLIPVPNGFIIPGGRFREYYYWDSYWIIKGLLISEMAETARGMIDNFLYLVKTYGFIPNGGRIYYLNRSQPPLLTKMVAAYFRSNSDKVWLSKNIRYLDAELQFWLTRRTVQIHKDDTVYTMAHYNAESQGPRPESYFQDYSTASFYTNPNDQIKLYVNLKSAAESGWDFSSRWIIDDAGGNNGNLTDIQTKRIIPVDLNSYLCEAFYLISELYNELSEKNASFYWKRLGDNWRKSIREVLWNDNDGIWYDFDQDLSTQRKYFYPSNVAPLWANCVDLQEQTVMADRALKYLVSSGSLKNPGGIPTSLFHTGEQWDFPNAWAPLQAITVQALLKSTTPQTIEKAKELAHQWIKANLVGFLESTELYEKYDTLIPGKYGGGGEYIVQAGFGWTNGVVLDFINELFSNNRTN